MDEILESRLKRFPRFVLHFCPRKRHHHRITNTVFFLIFYIVPATLPSAFLTTHTNSGFIIDDRIPAYFTRTHFRFYFFFHSLILLRIIFVIRRYPVWTSRRSFTPIPWMIMRKSMCMIAILMKIIPISYCFSIMVVPSALFPFAVYIFCRLHINLYVSLVCLSALSFFVQIFLRSSRRRSELLRLPFIIPPLSDICIPYCECFLIF